MHGVCDTSLSEASTKSHLIFDLTDADLLPWAGRALQPYSWVPDLEEPGWLRFHPPQPRAVILSCLSSGSSSLHQTFLDTAEDGKRGRSHTAVLCQWGCHPLSPCSRLALNLLSSGHFLCIKMEFPPAPHALINPKGSILLSAPCVRWKSRGRSWIYTLWAEPTFQLNHAAFVFFSVLLIGAQPSAPLLQCCLPSVLGK